MNNTFLQCTCIYILYTHVPLTICSQTQATEHCNERRKAAEEFSWRCTRTRTRTSFRLHIHMQPEAQQEAPHQHCTDAGIDTHICVTYTATASKRGARVTVVERVTIVIPSWGKSKNLHWPFFFYNASGTPSYMYRATCTTCNIHVHNVQMAVTCVTLYSVYDLCRREAEVWGTLPTGDCTLGS